MRQPQFAKMRMSMKPVPAGIHLRPTAEMQTYLRRRASDEGRTLNGLVLWLVQRALDYEELVGDGKRDNMR